MGPKWAKVSAKYDVDALKEGLKTKEPWAVQKIQEIGREFILSQSFIYKYFGYWPTFKVKRENPDEVKLFIKNEVGRQTGWNFREFVKRLKNNEKKAIDCLKTVQVLSEVSEHFFYTHFKEFSKHDFQRTPRDI